MQKTNRTAVRASRGFTLLEVMIVIVIILAILGLVTVNLMGAKKKADSGTTQIQLGTIKQALNTFYLDFSRYPEEDGEGLAVLWNKSALPEEDQAKWREGGYLQEEIPRDQWGSEWVYRVESADSATGSTGGVQVWSMGPDKQDGTEDDVYPGGKKPQDSESSDVGPPSSGSTGP